MLKFKKKDVFKENVFSKGKYRIFKIYNLVPNNVSISGSHYFPIFTTNLQNWAIESERDYLKISHALASCMCLIQQLRRGIQNILVTETGPLVAFVTRKEEIINCHYKGLSLM
jgi:hypothetical protein